MMADRENHNHGGSDRMSTGCQEIGSSTPARGMTDQMNPLPQHTLATAGRNAITLVWHAYFD